MATITRSQMLKELLPGLNRLFGLEYNTYKMEWKEIFDVENSERSFEEEAKLAGFSGATTKPEGAPVDYDIAQEAWVARYVHETVSKAFVITEEAIEDNLYASLAQRYTKAVARSMAYTEEVKGAAILNNSFSSNYKGGDGVALCSTSHPLVSGGFNSNVSSAHVDLNETSLEAAVIQMAAWTDERGLLIAAKPRKLIIPPALAFVAQRILRSELRPGTMNNDINALRSMGAIPEGFTVNHFLVNPTQWWIKTDVPNGLKRFNRRALKVQSEGDFDTGNLRVKATMRYKFGWSDPLGVWGSN